MNAHPTYRHRTRERNFVWLLFSFEGRASRAAFWLVQLMCFGIAVPMVIWTRTQSMPALFWRDVAEPIVIIILAWPSLAIQVKRWHDIDRTGWWVLVNFVPWIGWIISLVANGFLPGTDRVNDYGEDPTELPSSPQD